jgi:histone-lysine N-methyltransferase SETMAR
MIILAYDSQGVLVCHHLRCAVREKRPELLDNAIILHDNTTSHTADTVRCCLQRWGWEVLQHPSYSPDLSPCDFDLIPKVKKPLRGKRFADKQDILTAFRRDVAHISESHAADSIHRLPHRWQ